MIESHGEKGFSLHSMSVSQRLDVLLVQLKMLPERTRMRQRAEEEEDRATSLSSDTDQMRVDSLRHTRALFAVVRALLARGPDVLRRERQVHRFFFLSHNIYLFIS